MTPARLTAGRPSRFTSWRVATIAFFPLEFQRRVARERLGVDPVVVPGGHLVALSRPDELAAVIARYLENPSGQGLV
jgi:hypothetical protein